MQRAHFRIGGAARRLHVDHEAFAGIEREQEVRHVSAMSARPTGLEAERLRHDPNHGRIEVRHPQASLLEATLEGHMRTRRRRLEQARVVPLIPVRMKRPKVKRPVKSRNVHLGEGLSDFLASLIEVANLSVEQLIRAHAAMVDLRHGYETNDTPPTRT